MTKKSTQVKPSEDEVQNALNVILSDRSSYGTSLNYAIDYVRRAKEMTEHELEVQCLYVLNNITHWRFSNGSISAKDVRNVLKRFAGVPV
jgi:hypothetical protein